MKTKTFEGELWSSDGRDNEILEYTIELSKHQASKLLRAMNAVERLSEKIEGLDSINLKMDGMDNIIMFEEGVKHYYDRDTSRLVVNQGSAYYILNSETTTTIYKTNLILKSELMELIGEEI